MDYCKPLVSSVQDTCSIEGKEDQDWCSIISNDEMYLFFHQLRFWVQVTSSSSTTSCEWDGKGSLVKVNGGVCKGRRSSGLDLEHT